MDADGAREFLQSHHRGVLATFRADGRPQLTPITCGVDAEGRVIISTREAAVKTRNLRRDPRASVLVLRDEFWGGGVQVEGDVEIVSLPDAMEPLVDYYRRISGEHPDWDDYRAAMTRDRRVLVRITITRAGPNVEG
jgi:PPOX class probable F420-dependent enzyme